MFQSQDTCEVLTSELMQTKKRLVETEEEKQRLECESQQVRQTTLTAINEKTDRGDNSYLDK